MREKLILQLQSLEKPTRAKLRDVMPDKDWVSTFGNFGQFKLAAGLGESKLEMQYYNQIASCDSNYVLNKLNEKKHEYSEKYLRPDNNRFQTVLVGSDFHSELCDEFSVSCFIDAAARIKPSIICLAGDVLDFECLNTHQRVDPRRFTISQELKWLDIFLGKLREVSPDSQITYLEGNHEARLLRHFANDSPYVRELLHEYHGFDFGKLLGLDKHSVNFISKSDLSVYKESAIKREVAKNYIVIHDTLAIGHTPEIKKLKMQSFHGHHHQYSVQNDYSLSQGAFQHIQLGAMCKLDAHYCDAQHWQSGFAIAHIDVETKGCQVEYIDTSNEFCMIGGKFYSRNEESK